MELFSPFKDNKEKRNYFIAIFISIIVFFLFDYCYELNLFYLKGVVYRGEHTIPAFLYSISNVPFLVATMSTLAKFSRGIIEWFRYVASFVVDVCIVYMFFAFRDPSLSNTELFSGGENILSSSSIHTLEEIIIKTKGDIKEIDKLIANDRNRED